MNKLNTFEDPDAWRQRIYAMLEREKMIVVNGKWRVPEMVGSDGDKDKVQDCNAAA